jgi:hypothetical protein
VKAEEPRLYKGESNPSPDPGGHFYTIKAAEKNGSYDWTDASVTIKNLPLMKVEDGKIYFCRYYVLEQSISGVEAAYTPAAENKTYIQSDEIIDGTVTISNHFNAYDLHATGGAGSRSLTLYGILMLLTAGIGYSLLRRWEQKQRS